jgi:transcriptional regulator with XRE-family HTH domain
MAERRESFGEVTREVLGDLTQRELGRMADVSHAYVNDWLQDRRPSLRTLVRAAGKLEAGGRMSPELRARWFAAAGYVDPGPEAPEPWSGRRATPSESAEEILGRGVLEVYEILHRPFTIDLDEETARNLTPDQARETVETWKRLAREGTL